MAKSAEAYMDIIMRIKQDNSTFDDIVRLIESLRAPGGCPWDRQQTRHSLKRQFLEECYELLEAIERDDQEAIVEEMGDVLLHMAFQVQIAAESDEFSQQDVFIALRNKIVRRHPHVFGDSEVGNAMDVEVKWEAIKREERPDNKRSILDGAPKNMPALGYAQSVQDRASRLGFDWEESEKAIDKVAEELREIEMLGSRGERCRELGDLLFSIVNVGRWWDCDVEGALREANARFYSRFVSMEHISSARGRSLSDLSMSEKKLLWQEVKRAEYDS